MALEAILPSRSSRHGDSEDSSARERKHYGNVVHQNGLDDVRLAMENLEKNIRRHRQRLGTPSGHHKPTERQKTMRFRTQTRELTKLLEIEKSGGKGGILFPPFLASADESYTSAIIACT